MCKPARWPEAWVLGVQHVRSLACFHTDDHREKGTDSRRGCQNGGSLPTALRRGGGLACGPPPAWQTMAMQLRLDMVLTISFASFFSSPISSLFFLSLLFSI